MTQHRPIFGIDPVVAPAPMRHPFELSTALMAPFYSSLKATRETVTALAEICEPHLAKRLDAVKDRIDGFEPNVTLVGQVKAGKTALTNVLSGHLGLLPSDVNPMTSVITTLHLNKPHADNTTKAAFELFAQQEWEGLVEGGGRLGELAGRAGAEDEMHSLRAQIEEMRRTAQSRLGADFEELLGQVHKYDHCDKELVERYVCLGDPDEIEENPESRQGCYADITKSADLYLSQKHLPGALSLRDTPGVNDTFMVREQITLRSLTDSQVCVIVLSAHEALNTSDLALVRLISSIEQRQLVLFVNRIDELPKPSVQIPEIRESILRTLDGLNAAKKTAVLFGSARWAEIALARDFGDMDDEQRAALYDWAGAVFTEEPKNAFEFTWLLSGVPELMNAVYERVLERSGKRLVTGIRARLNNVINEIRAKTENTVRRLTPEDVDSLTQDLDRLITERCEELDGTLDRLLGDFRPRLQRVKQNYVARATEALVTHLQHNGQQETWSFGSSGLRFVLKSTYVRFADAATTEIEEVYQSAANSIRELYLDRLGVKTDGFDIEAPDVPAIPPPVVLGQTIAIDLSGNWWKRWWNRRRGIHAYSEDYSRLISAEVGSIIRDLESTQFSEVLIEMRTILRDFLIEQKDAVLRLVNTAEDTTTSAPTECALRDDELIEALEGAVEALDFARSGE